MRIYLIVYLYASSSGIEFKSLNDTYFQTRKACEFEVRQIGNVGRKLFCISKTKEVGE
jgi:hypothetical protein